MTTVDRLHALLFVADAPLDSASLGNALGLPEGPTEEALDVLAHRLNREGPVQLVRLAGGWQLSTKPEYAELVGAFLRPQRGRLGRSLMEVLAIVAYRQPVTVTEIDAVRGVQSDHAIRALAERRLVREVGRKPVPGRPVLYGTTDQFLHHFLLEDLSALPPLADEVMPTLTHPDELLHDEPNGGH